MGGGAAGRTMNPSRDEYLKKKEEAISFQFVGADLFCPPLVCVSTPMVQYYHVENEDSS